MLLLSSKKYPNVEDNQQFWVQNEGELKSYTKWVSTNYNFFVKNSAFQEGLDRFANFFSNPLFPEDYEEDSIKNVQIKYKNALQNDHWHHMNLWLKMSNTDSPINRFTFGTAETLEKLDAREIMLNFHKQYYSANTMTLCVISNMNTIDLEKMVTSKFKGIKN